MKKITLSSVSLVASFVIFAPLITFAFPWPSWKPRIAPSSNKGLPGVTQPLSTAPKAVVPVKAARPTSAQIQAAQKIIKAKKTAGDKAGQIVSSDLQAIVDGYVFNVEAGKWRFVGPRKGSVEIGSDGTVIVIGVNGKIISDAGYPLSSLDDLIWGAVVNTRQNPAGAASKMTEIKEQFTRARREYSQSVAGVARAEAEMKVLMPVKHSDEYMQEYNNRMTEAIRRGVERRATFPDIAAGEIKFAKGEIAKEKKKLPPQRDEEKILASENYVNMLEATVKSMPAVPVR